MELILLIICCLLIAVVLVITLSKSKAVGAVGSEEKVAALQEAVARLEKNIKDDFQASRQEQALQARDGRAEISQTLKDITLISQNSMKGINDTLSENIRLLSERLDNANKANREALSASLKDFSLEQRTKSDEFKDELKSLRLQTVDQLARIQDKVEEKLMSMIKQMSDGGLLMQDALQKSFKQFGDHFQMQIESFNNTQKEKFSQLEARQQELVKSTESKLENIRTTVEEKLEKTLTERIGHSFKTVNEQLVQVQKGLGEMQTLAQDVGGLKRVLTNVKMRGGFGEVQLQMLLENILAPEQFEANVLTKKGGSERVEFAVKFPNKDGSRESIWLPIDAKFPKDAYEHLQNAYDTGDTQLIESAQKSLEAVIKKMAKDICEKYIDVPNTTNFGIMFLPFEGLFAEVVRKASLLEEVQRDCNVIITGPTTLAVILNSLQMGFKTLAIQKRSSEVWNILAGVKKEFNQFGGLIGKAQKNIQTGLNQLDDVVGVRTRAIQRQLRDVETLETEKEIAFDLPMVDEELLEDKQ